MPATEFIFNWRIDWNQFETLSDVEEIKSGIFVISKNKILFWFEAALLNSRMGDPRSKFMIVCRGLGGYKSVLYKSEQWHSANLWRARKCISGYKITVAINTQQGDFEELDVDRWCYRGLCNKINFQEVMELTDYDSLIFRFTITIDDDVFAGVCCKFPELKPASAFTINMYKKIETAPAAGDFFSQLTDVKLLSNDGVEFNGNRVILAAPSNTLTAFFSHLVDEGNEKNIFSKMHSTSLKFLLQFIYTGVVEFAELQPEILLDLVDAGERYDLPILKEACFSVLETKMLENPEIAPMVVKAADMYNFQNLMLLAADVSASNYLGFKFQDGLTKIVDSKLLQEFMDRSVARFYVPGGDDS